MREIKFRRWSGPWSDGKYRMIYSGDLREEGNADNFSFDNGILMQYTGLKDKNGTEIYEGDILEITELSGRIGEYKVGRYTVNFDAGAYVAGDLYVGGGYKLGLVAHRAKVIGNIYEHPHLLGGGEG